MKLQLNSKYKNLLFFDIEYDTNSLVQLALLIFEQEKKNIYKLSKSINFYIKQDMLLNKFFIDYTNINDKFLDSNGIELWQAQSCIDDELKQLDWDKSCVISHGVKNDLKILNENGINLSKIPNHYCTYNAAKKLLKRENHLTLKDIAAEDCFYMFNEHNAYADVWGTVFSYCFLNELEKEN